MMNAYRELMDDDNVPVLCVGGPFDGTLQNVSMAALEASLPIMVGNGGTPYRWFGLTNGETMVIEAADVLSMWWRSLDPGERGAAVETVRSRELDESLLQALDNAHAMQDSLAFQAAPERSGRMPTDVEKTLEALLEAPRANPAQVPRP